MYKAIVILLFFCFRATSFALDNMLHYPDWFKLSLLDLSDDLRDLKASNKKYLILFMSQQGCGFCRLHLKNNWGDPQRNCWLIPKNILRWWHWMSGAAVS